LNPIEHAWDKLQQAISAHPILPRNREGLSAALVEEWAKFFGRCRGVVARLFKHGVVIQNIEHIRTLRKLLHLNFPSFTTAVFHSILEIV
jgi:hypothetical protein